MRSFTDPLSLAEISEIAPEKCLGGHIHHDDHTFPSLSEINAESVSLMAAVVRLEKQLHAPDLDKGDRRQIEETLAIMKIQVFELEALRRRLAIRCES